MKKKCYLLTGQQCPVDHTWVNRVLLENPEHKFFYEPNQKYAPGISDSTFTRIKNALNEGIPGVLVAIREMSGNTLDTLTQMAKTFGYQVELVTLE